MRLGAIYALEKLARDYEPLHWPIMEILCAYVRKNAGKPLPLPEEIIAIYAKQLGLRSQEERTRLANRNKELGTPFVDVQAALTVIGRRPEYRRDQEDKWRADPQAGQDYRLELTNCNLAVANVDGLHFEHAKFDRTYLEGASLATTHLEYSQFESAHLEGARFPNARLKGANLQEAHLEGAVLMDAHLEGALLDYARLEGADLYNAHLEGASFTQAYMEGANLDFAHLEYASLVWARLKNANLNRAYLDGAAIDGADLRGVSFNCAHLEGASLESACLDGAFLTGAYLMDTWLDRTNLANCRHFEAESVAGTWGDHVTELPEGIERPQNERWVTENLGVEERNERFARWRARREFWLAEAKRRAAKPETTATL